MTMKKILVSGSEGFIGRALIDSLEKHKQYYVGVSRKKSSKQILKNDIRKIRTIPKGISCIVHLAAMTDVKKCQENSKICMDININGTRNMLELARKTDSKFIFSSTSHVYGKPSKLPITEDQVVHPTSFYALSKACAELLCETYSRAYGLDIVILRNFSTYGPNNPSYSVTHTVIKQILEGKNIQIGNLHPKRDFIYISDVISAFQTAIKKDLKGFSIFNVGTGKSISIDNVCKKLITISGKKIKIKEKKNSTINEVQNIYADNYKLKKLGWKPTVNLDSGLKKTYNWFEKQYNRN